MFSIIFGLFMDAERTLPTISEVEFCLICLEEDVDLPVTSCCGQTIHLMCLDICLKMNNRCPHCRCGLERVMMILVIICLWLLLLFCILVLLGAGFCSQGRVLQNRSIYLKILHEVGPKKTRKVHQDRMGHFYLDLAKVLCTVGCKSAVVRMKFSCGMNGFLEIVKSISGIELLEEQEEEEEEQQQQQQQ